MAISDELFGFVREALGRGQSRNAVEGVLLEAGWSRDQVNTGLAGFADVEFPIPVPRPKPYLSARDAFFYLLLFGTLYVSAFHLGSLVFDFINRALPDSAQSLNIEYWRQSVRWALASLIVTFPVFLYLSATDGRSIRRDPSTRRSQIRQSLTYLTLLIAASVLIGDVITLVYNLLGGELTTRFILKVLTIAIIAGTIFFHYLAGLRLEHTKPIIERTARGRLVGFISMTAAAAVVVTGLFLLGAPSAERIRRLDGRRIGDLQRLSRGTEIYWSRHKRLPTSIGELDGEGGLAVGGRDPAGEPYGYRTTGERSYELCANFTTDSAAAGSGTEPGFWSHRAGRQCYQLEAKESR
jgi:Domain of unknown function (DUF5671)